MVLRDKSRRGCYQKVVNILTGVVESDGNLRIIIFLYVFVQIFLVQAAEWDQGEKFIVISIFEPQLFLDGFLYFLKDRLLFLLTIVLAAGEGAALERWHQNAHAQGNWRRFLVLDKGMNNIIVTYHDHFY
jgi:hypothetical protein